MKLNRHQHQIHERAMAVAVRYQKAESEMIQILQEADRIRLHRSFGLSSLLKYSVKYLKLSEPLALAFIAVARKAIEVSSLKVALDEGKLSVSTANRLVSTITNENAASLIDFAATHSWREMEREIARRNPRAAIPDKVKMLGNGLVQMTITVTEEDHTAFERARSIEAQRKGKAPSRGQALRATVDTHLDKYDPVRKAERAQKKAANKYSVRTEQAVLAKTEKLNDSGAAKGRILLKAEQSHAVHLRDQGRCTHINESGDRCNQDRWLQIHHIIPVSKGGTNDIENLTTLCSTHHDLVHQLSLPLEGQITWLRSPQHIYQCVYQDSWRKFR